MADHTWSIEAEHFGYLCSIVLKPETGAYSCFASAKPMPPPTGTLDVTLDAITIESEGDLL
jgi:hypothetical protein